MRYILAGTRNTWNRKQLNRPSFTAIVRVTGSAEFPELRVEAEWDKEGARGGVVIECGRLVDKWTGERSPA